MVRFLSLAAAMLAGLSAVPLSARAATGPWTLYGCTFAARSGGADEIRTVFLIDANGAPFTLEPDENDGPPRIVPVEMQPAGNGQAIFTHAFTLPNPDRGSFRAVVQARVTLAGGAARFVMRGRGMQGEVRGTGTCERRDGVRLPD